MTPGDCDTECGQSEISLSCQNRCFIFTFSTRDISQRGIFPIAKKRFPLTIIILKSVHVTKFNSIQINLAHVYRKYLQLNYAVSILEKISICF